MVTLGKEPLSSKSTDDNWDCKGPLLALVDYRSKAKPDTGRNKKILPKKAMITYATKREVQSNLPKGQSTVEDKAKWAQFHSRGNSINLGSSHCGTHHSSHTACLSHE